MQRVVPLFAACLLWASVAPAQSFTNPKEAGPDFAIQGEYAGQLDHDGSPVKWGAQVIALGDGKFHLVGFQGGLPGDGWQRGDKRVGADGSLADGVATFKSDQWTAEIADGKLTVREGDTKLGQLAKVERKSPTLGKAAPEGAKVLFDGSEASLEHWNNGQLVEGELLGATNCFTKEKFGDHAGHLEFRTPFMPKARGQGRGNSGLYVQSRYEVQILDSFGLEGKNNECGGVYTIAEPAVNMCLPPLSWQTYDWEFKAARYDDQGKKISNARLTMKHNGVVIYDDLELPKGTPGRANEGPGPEAVFLQNHGDPVAFRNVWVIER